MTKDFSPEAYKALEERISNLIEPARLAELSSEVLRLESMASAPGVWNDREAAEQLLSELSTKRRFLDELASLRRSLSDLWVLWQLALEAQDDDELSAVAKEYSTLELRVEKLLVSKMLSGIYDEGPAVMVIRSGAGGDDATDFAEMLLRMYLRYADQSELRANVLNVSHAEGAGIKSASISFEGAFAFGKLSVESGTHRLVRISPFNSAGKRQTSFAAVEVVPLIESTNQMHIPEKDIRIDFFRSSGPGGQSVNTTDSAVRVTHLPTGTTVSCQNEKSQLQNKITAIRVLQSRLLEAHRKEEEAKKKELAGDLRATWGEQIRSYVLAPYQMVKDHRTHHEEKSPDEVLDGNLEGFISEGIRWRAQQNSKHTAG